MNLTKENIKGRKEIRKLIERAEILGHVSHLPIKVVFKPSSAMDGSWGDVEKKSKHFVLSFDDKYMQTPHGRELCIVIAVHELAHIYSWSSNPRVEAARDAKYGEHGPEFGVVYAQLWSDLMDSDYEYGDDENIED